MVQMWMLITILMRPLISWQREETDSETDAGIHWQTHHKTHLLSPWGDVCNDQDRWIKYHFLSLWDRCWNLLAHAPTRLLSPSGTVSLYIDWDQLIDSIETIQDQNKLLFCLILVNVWLLRDFAYKLMLPNFVHCFFEHTSIETPPAGWCPRACSCSANQKFHFGDGLPRLSS